MDCTEHSLNFHPQHEKFVVCGRCGRQFFLLPHDYPIKWGQRSAKPLPLKPREGEMIVIGGTNIVLTWKDGAWRVRDRTTMQLEKCFIWTARKFHHLEH